MKNYLTGVFFYELYPGKPFLHDLRPDEGQPGSRETVWAQMRVRRAATKPFGLG
jgi:hypothetical protein